MVQQRDCHIADVLILRVSLQREFLLRFSNPTYHITETLTSYKHEYINLLKGNKKKIRELIKHEHLTQANLNIKKIKNAKPRREVRLRT